MENINAVSNYNNKSFLGNSSAKPICGKPLYTLYKNNIQQGKLNITNPIPAGAPIKATNENLNSSYAGKGLSPNVLSITAAAAAADVCGFLLVNETDVLESGSAAPSAQNGQVVQVGLLGSGVEVYLPVAAAVAGVATSSKLAWDFTAGNLVVNAAGTISLVSPVVDGVRFKYDATSKSIVYEDCKCAKVRL